MLPGRTLRYNILAIVSICLALSGCAGGGLSKAVGKTLQVVGIKDAPPQVPPTVPMRLIAGKNLNAGNSKKATAAVLKIYHLRSAQRFEQAPFSAFLDQAGEQAALGADLLSVNEIVLMPGMKQELKEKLSDGTRVLGVVALFRAPAKERWRFTFDATREELPREGITIGAHACALTTSSSALVTSLTTDSTSLASIQCAAAR